MRRTISILLALAIALSCTGIAVAAESGDALTISAPVSATPGETILVTVTMPEGTNAVNGSFNLVYDNAALEVISGNAGTILADGAVTVNPTYAPNAIRLSFDGVQPLSKGGVVLHASFRVLTGASGTVKFSAEKYKIFDSDYVQISAPETAETATFIVNDSKTKVSLQASSATVSSGDTVTVFVDLDNPVGVYGGGLNVCYNADMFVLDSAVGGTAISGYSRHINTKYAANKVRITWAGPGAMASGGTVLQLVFTVKDGTTGEGAFTFDKLSLSDMNGFGVECVAEQTSVQVSCKHRVMEWVTTTDATCTEKGEETYSCNCGYATETRELSATGHMTMEWVVTTAATCDVSGLKSYACVGCGYAEATEEIPAHGHLMESIITPPTQAESGYTTHICSECGYSYTDSETLATGYTVTYDANGGSSAPAAEKKLHGAAMMLSDVLPYREGYTFLGWSAMSGSESAEYPAGGTYTEDSDITLYAVWSVNEYKITYTVDGVAYAVQAWKYGDVINAQSEPEKAGHTFSGWNELPVTMPAKDLTITGSFSINTYTVTFDANGGEGGTAEMDATYGSSIVLPTNVPTKAGSQFLGWAQKPTARKAAYKSGEWMKVEENVTLYAVWSTIWDGSVAESFAGGSGTSRDPYRIENASQLALLAKLVNENNADYNDACYIITADITLNDCSNVENWATTPPANEWTPIGWYNSATDNAYFYGVFDGNGYTVSGMYVNETDATKGDYQGFFGVLQNATLSNLTLADGIVYASDYVGGISGHARESIIVNCHNYCSISASHAVGGVLGVTKNSVSTINCSNHGTITSNSVSVGGVVGYASLSSIVTGCYNFGDVMAVRDFGGICGFSGETATVSQCVNFGHITGDGTSGGIVGACYRGSLNFIQNCINLGSLTAPVNVGGICGYGENNDSTTECVVSNCINMGTISKGGNYISAILGDEVGVVENCFYLDTCGVTGKGTPLTADQLATPGSIAGITGESWEENWYLCSNYYASMLLPVSAKGKIEVPVQLNPNGGSFQEYEACNKVAASGKNISRGTDSLVIYNKRNGTTGTQTAGCEVLVDSRNLVTAIHSDNGNHAVPFGGFVLSGQGIMAKWLRESIAVGDKVYTSTNNNNVTVYKKDPAYSMIYGSFGYLPTPHKSGYVFNGWYDKTGTNIKPSYRQYFLDSTSLVAQWKKADIQASCEYNGHTYYRFDATTTYPSAKRFCEDMGGHLAVITSAGENAVVAGMVATGPRWGYLLGASDLKNDHTFEWVTGESMSYRNWDTGEPSDYEQKEEFLGMFSSNGKWNDISKTSINHYGFVCEIDNLKPELETIYNGHLYQYYGTSVSWDYAKTYCENQGGHLATLTSAEEHDAVWTAGQDNRSLCKKFYYFTGATDLDAEGEWKWITGENWDYTDWRPGQPDNSEGKEHYLHLYLTYNDFNGHWNDLPTTYQDTGFLLEQDSLTPVSRVTSGDHEYLLFDAGGTWEEAREYCRSIGGHLAAVNSQEEWETITSLVNAGSRNSYYMGGIAATSGSAWHWITGEQFNAFGSWKDGQTPTGEKLHLELYRNGTAWNYNPATNAYASGRGFICEIDRSGQSYDRERSGVFADVSWVIEDNVLQLSGQGSIAGASAYPWDAFASEITEVIVGEGITEIGSALQSAMATVTTVTLPESLTQISANFQAEKLSSVKYNGSAHTWSKVICEDSALQSADVQFAAYAVIYDTFFTDNVTKGKVAVISAEIPEKDNHAFLGWSKSQNATAAEYKANDSLNITADTQLYAVWSKNAYGLSYDANGGENAPKTQSYPLNEVSKTTVSTEIPMRNGFVFGGWATNADAMEASYQPGDSITVSSDVILYAVWREGQQGTISDSVYWSLEGGTLTISGSGSMKDYTQGAAPWYDYRAQITKIVIEDGITSIGAYAFYKCDAARTAELNGVATIGAYAFADCLSLQSVDLTGTEEIGQYAFRYCAAMESVTIPASVKTMGIGVFSNCDAMASVTLEAGQIELPQYAFADCGSIQSVSISSGYEELSSSVFTGSEIDKVTFDGTKEEFASLLSSAETLKFEEVFCKTDNKTYAFADFFPETSTVSKITISKMSLGMQIGDTEKLTVTIEPENTDENLTWKTDNVLVATVDASGLVTAVGAGIANITVTAEDSGTSAVCVVYVSAPVAADAPAIVCESAESRNGKTVDVAIALQKNPGLISLKLNVSYDDTVMSLVGVKDSGKLGSAVHSADYSLHPYVLYWDNGASAENILYNGEIAVLSFEIADNAAAGEYPISIGYEAKNYDSINSDLLPIDFEISNGYISVETFIYGDVNGDKAVNALDSALLARYIGRWSGVAVDTDAADVNKDGKINALDSAILKRHIAKWPDYRTLPYKEGV